MHADSPVSLANVGIEAKHPRPVVQSMWWTTAWSVDFSALSRSAAAIAPYQSSEFEPSRAESRAYAPATPR